MEQFSFQDLPTLFKWSPSTLNNRATGHVLLNHLSDTSGVTELCTRASFDSHYKVGEGLFETHQQQRTKLLQPNSILAKESQAKEDDTLDRFWERLEQSGI